MKDTGEGHHDDFMRAFFRLRVYGIGEISSWILPILNRVRAEAPNLPALGPTLAEANRVVLVGSFDLSPGFIIDGPLFSDSLDFRYRTQEIQSQPVWGRPSCARPVDGPDAYDQPSG